MNQPGQSQSQTKASLKTALRLALKNWFYWESEAKRLRSILDQYANRADQMALEIEALRNQTEPLRGKKYQKQKGVTR